MKTGLSANAASCESPWAEIHRILNVKTGLARIFANFAGAAVCYSYFTFFDSSAPVSLITRGFLITIAMFAGLVVFGYILSRRWEKGLIQYVDAKIAGGSISETLEKEARRKILNLPLMKLRTRMFIAFMLAGIVPLILMAILSYNKARLILVMNPEEVIQSLFHLTAFLLIAALLVTVILSYLVSTSIIGPVKDMETAMIKVRGGDLTTSARIAANDELGVLAESFDQMIEGLRDRERIKETFGRFVTPEIAKAILENPSVPGGENTEVSILFSDIRNYTTICEQLSPKEVIALLNDYFSYMVRAVEKHRGLVYQFVGDSVNLAARIEALNKEFHTDVLISRATVDQLKDRFNLKAFQPVKVKGKEDYVQVFEVTR